MRRIGVALSVAAALCLAACGTSGAPTVTQTVTQGGSTTPAPSPSTSGSGSTTNSGGGGGGQTVPGDLVGKNLSDAESELDGVGISYTTQTNNGEEVILPFDWGVCSTTPSPGQSASGGVVLNVGHFTCGGG